MAFSEKLNFIAVVVDPPDDREGVFITFLVVEAGMYLPSKCVKAGMAEVGGPWGWWASRSIK